MNEWSRRTLHLVETQDYLDRLHTVYPNEEGERNIEASVIDTIRQFYERRDEINLLSMLLDLEKFPYKDSYVAFLRRDRTAITRNPDTVRRICDRLYEMGIENIIGGLTKPKEANTRRGNQFRDWIKRTFSRVTLDQFRTSTSGVVLLDSNEHEARDFCNTEMGVGITKRPDIVVKSGRRYIIGEAKFLSSTGGNQGRAFDDGIGLATNNTGSAFKIFVLDGIHWIEHGSEQYRRIEYGIAAVFSVLLLEEYLNNVPQ